MVIGLLRQHGRRLSLVVLLLGAIQAQAEKPAPSWFLSWARSPGAESCIDPRALNDLVTARLGGHAPESPGDTASLIEGVISRDGNEWLASFSVRDRTGAEVGFRELRSARPGCRDLDEGLVLIISLLVEPTGFSRTRAPLEPTLASSPPLISHSPLPSPWGFSAGLIGSSGIVWAPSGGVRLAGTKRFSRALLEVAAIGWLSRRDPIGGFAADTRGYALEAVACPVLIAQSWFRGDVCAQARGGFLQVHGVGFDENFARNLGFIDYGFRTRVGFAREGWGAHLYAGAFNRASATDLAFADRDGTTNVVHRMPGGGIDVGLSFTYELEP